MKLREYQTRTIQAIRHSYATGHRAPVVVAPTGSGKTVVAAEVMRLARARGKRVLFNAHRAELIDQTIRKLCDAGVTGVRRIQAGRSGAASDIAVASVQTLTNWTDEEMPDADVVVFDECHHGPTKTWARIANRYQRSLLLGLSATPERADGRPLGDVFDDLIVAASVQELTDLGHLVPCRIWAPPSVMDTGRIALSPLTAYQQHGGNDKAIAFCSTLERAAAIADEFNAAGLTAAVIHGSVSSEMRSRIYQWFRDGQLRVLVSVHVLTEGFDEPSAAVCILERKPAHAGTFLQMVGRVLRPSPGKTHATLIDLCGSSLVHGTPAMEREYSLDGRAISKPARDAIKQCQSCGAVYLAGPGACPMCGVEPERRAIQMPTAMGVELVSLEDLPKLQPRAVTLSITAKFPSRCHKCNGHIPVGEQVYWVKGVGVRHLSDECWWSKKAS